LGLPAKAGLPTLIVRETSIYHLQQRFGLLNGLLRLSNIFVISYSLAIAAIAYGFALVYSDNFDRELLDVFLVALLLLPLVAFGNIRCATLRGLRKVVQGQFPEDVIRPGVLVILLLFAYAWSVQLTPMLAI